MLTHDQKASVGFTYVMNLASPVSPYGRQALRCMSPAKPGQEETIKRELGNIEKTIVGIKQNEAEFVKLEELLGQTKDIKKSISLIGEMLSEVDLFEIKRYLIQLEQIVPLFNEINKHAKYSGIALESATNALKILDPENSNVATFHISSKSFPALAEIRSEKKEIEQKIRMNQSDAEKTRLTALRAQIAAREQKEEQKALMWISKKLQPWREALLQNAQTIGVLDLTIQKAKLASKYKSCMPEIKCSGISFEEMTNPEIHDVLLKSGGAFTPLSMELSKGSTVITGANMGGKSVALKTIALNTLLVHYGFFPFAKKASCQLLDSVYIISDNLEASDRGLSSFGGEIVRFQEILNEAINAKTLILLDEFARGTNPAEGKAIVKAVCTYMNSQEKYTVMTTHYEGIATVAKTHYQVAGLRKMELTKSFIEEMQKLKTSERIARIAKYMDYGLLKVSPGEKLPEDAVNICKLLGFERGIMDLIY